MRLSDTWLGLISLAAAVSLGWYAAGLPTIPGQNYGPAAFPTMISVGFFLCSVALLYQGYRRPRLASEAELPLWQTNPRGLAGVGLTAGLIIFYILAAKPLGFIPVAILVTFAMFVLLKVPVLKALIIAIIAAFVCDFLFRTMLLVPLPQGLMPRLPW